MSPHIGPEYHYAKAMALGGLPHNQTVMERAPPEMHHLVDAYWNQFPPMDTLWYGILIFAMSIITAIAMCGNLMVIYIFSTTKALRTPSNLLVINLAVSDFLLIFTMGPPMIVNCYYETWIFGPLFCDIYGMFGSMFGCASIWTMCVIALDRYNIIVKGLSARPLTNCDALLYILGVWTMASIWTIAPLIGWGRYTAEGNLTTCGTDYFNRDMNNFSYLIIYSSFVYVTPLGLIIYSYWFIIQAVSAHEKNMREQAKKMNVASLRQTNDSQSTENKLAKVALTTISLWFVAWTPYLVINYSGMLQLIRLTPLYTIWGAVFAKANSMYNPIVYGISHPKYRAALFQRFPSLACADPAPITSSQADAVSTVSAVTNTDKSNA